MFEHRKFYEWRETRAGVLRRCTDELHDPALKCVNASDELRLNALIAAIVGDLGGIYLGYQNRTADRAWGFEVANDGSIACA